MLIKCRECEFIFRINSLDEPICSRCGADIDINNMELIFPVFQRKNRETIEKFLGSSNEGKYYFIVKGENREEQVVPFDTPQLVIGRIDADISLDDPRVSRKHALIERYSYQFYIRDLNSKNGTFINGNRIIEGKLNPTDVITIGISTIKFYKEE